MFTKSILFRSLSAVALLGISATASNAATVILGNNGLRFINNPGVSDASTGVTGLGAGVSFDLTITPTGFVSPAAVGSQGGGVGVQGGQAGAGVDNDFNGTGGTNTVAVETLEFTISNVMGAAAIDITGFQLRFGADAGANTEFYNIDGGVATGIGAATENVVIAPTTSVTIGALDDDGITGSDSRFAVQNLTVVVTPIPEPSAALLGLLACAFGLVRRRR